MSRLVLATCALVLIGSLSGETGRCSLTGTVFDPHGAPVAEAPIQLKNKMSGTLVRTRSESDGRFAFSGLAAGAYEFSIIMPCCGFEHFMKDLLLEEGKTAQVDMTLIETVNGATLGDDPATLAAVMRKRGEVPAATAPRAAGGRPDLSGVWIAIDDPYPEAPEPLPWAAAVIRQRLATELKDAPHNRCLPGPPPVPASASPFIEKFVQTPSLLVILFEDVPGFRQVFMDGRAHPSNWDPTWLGHSLGKWEGDELVVDTVGFNDRSWIGTLGDGYLPHTEMLHVTERYRRVDFGHMEATVTFEDSKTFVKPFKMNIKFALGPKEELMEYVCENNKPEHLVGK